MISADISPECSQEFLQRLFDNSFKDSSNNSTKDIFDSFRWICNFSFKKIFRNFSNAYLNDYSQVTLRFKKKIKNMPTNSIKNWPKDSSRSSLKDSLGNFPDFCRNSSKDSFGNFSKDYLEILPRIPERISLRISSVISPGMQNLVRRISSEISYISTEIPLEIRSVISPKIFEKFFQRLFRKFNRIYL